MKCFALLKLLRVHHWIKNGLVVLPLFFSGKLFSREGIFYGVCGFLLFSFLASAIYLFNDIQDLEKDRNHPEKRTRPLPAGIFSVRTAWILFFCLAVLAIAGDLVLSGNPRTFLILLTYLVINLVYSKGLKNVPVIDFSILAAGFVLRILYGGALSDIPISHWLFLCVLSAALFMAIGKRRNELRLSGNDGTTREVLKFYTNDFLDKNMYLAAVLTIVFYSLWTVSPVFPDIRMVYTVPLALLLFFRYSYLVELKNSSGDPVNVFFSDRLLQIVFFVFALTLLLIFLSCHYDFRIGAR